MKAIATLLASAVMLTGCVSTSRVGHARVRPESIRIVNHTSYTLELRDDKGSDIQAPVYPHQTVTISNWHDSARIKITAVDIHAIGCLMQIDRKGSLEAAVGVDAGDVSQTIHVRVIGLR